jgi:hypothetical protein
MYSTLNCLPSLEGFRLLSRKLSFLPKFQTERKQHLLAIGILFVCVMIAFPGLYSTMTPGLDDLSRLNVPQRMLVGWFYRHGQFPFWNPYSFGGQPLWAAGQSGPFYLPNALFVFLPVTIAIKTSYLFHELLAAVGMYWAVWQICRNRIGAIVAAVSFTTSGFMLGHLIHTQMYDAMSWLPMLVWSLLLLLERVTPWRVCAFSGTLAMEVYAGHPQVTFYVFLFVFLYLLLHFIQNIRHRQARCGILAVLAATLLGMLLSAPQWLPTLDFISYSSRAQTSSFFLLQGSMPPAGPLQWLSPFVFGGGYTNQPITQTASLDFYHSVLFWELTCYSGLVVLLLAGAVVIHAWRKSEPVRNLFLIGVLSFNLCLGYNGLLAGVLVHVPGFDLFRIPARYIGITDFCIAALAGISVGYLLQQGNPLRLRLHRWVGVLALLCALLLVVVKVIGPLHHTPALSFWFPFGLCLFISLVSLLYVSNIGWFYPVCISVLALFDCVTQSGSFSTYVLIDHPEFTHPSPAVSFIQHHLNTSDPFARVAALDDSTLSYDKTDAFRIPSLNGYDSLEPQWYANAIDLTWSAGRLLQQPRSVLDAMDVQYVVTANDSTLLPRATLGVQTWMHWIPKLPSECDGFMIRFDDAGDSMLGSKPLCSVTLVNGSHRLTQYIQSSIREYYLRLPSDWPQQSATQIRIDNQSWYSAYKVKDVQYMAGSIPVEGTSLAVDRWFGPQGWAKVYTDAQETIWQNPNPRLSAWVSTDPANPLLTVDSSTVKKESWSPNEQTWTVNTPVAGHLVLAQTYDPNWRVEVDGKTQSVVAIGKDMGGFLTGIPVSQGKHKVSLQYVPGGFPFGVALGAGGGCLWLLLLAFIPRSRKKTYKGH